MITLAEAKVGMSNKVDQQVIETFQRSSLLLDRLTFDDSISPGTGGSTLTYGYVQLQTPSTATTRAINTEYTPDEAKRVEKTTKAVIMGGSFQVDRVIQATSGAINELAFQAQQKIVATANEFHNLAVNGSKEASDAGYVAGKFDGIRKLLAGTSSVLQSTIDLSTGAKRTSNGQDFLDELDALVAAVMGGADVLLMNSKMLQFVRSVARRAGYYERTKDDLGRYVETYSGIPMLDLGTYWDKTANSGAGAEVPILGTSTPTSSKLGTTSIIAAKLGIDALHGISPSGGSMITSYMPDLNAPGAVKTGEVELVAGIALKNTRAAAMLDGIGILPKSA